MTDRYHGGYAPPGRSSTMSSANPARQSMPSSVGYSSLYAGDMHVMPSSTRHPMTTPRGYTTTTNNGVPTTTRTYTVTRDPRLGPSVAREHSRTRRSTMDSAPRPPVIVTTQQSGHQGHQSHQSNANHSATHSPVRNNPRASDGHLYAHPSSIVRSHSTAPTHGHRHSESDDYSRGRERERTEAALAARDAEAYRNSRPSVVYSSDPRHSTATVGYGDEGYQYTNAGELARYDLDHPVSTRSRRSRTPSLDRGYYRPNVNYSGDLSRNYTMNTSRPYESRPTRGGPPPSTRGFDKINQTYDSRDLPPGAPVPPSPTLSRHGEDSRGSLEVYEGKRSRPVSLYQDSSAPRSSHHDDYYRSREDERTMRELRDRERESGHIHEPPSRFHDESVATRGFGIRTAPVDDYDDRRDRRRESWREEPRREEPKKRSDEDVIIREAELDHDRRRRDRIDDKDEPRKRSDDDIARETEADRERRKKNLVVEKVEPRKWSDEDLPRESDADRERRRKIRAEDKVEPRKWSDEDLPRESEADRERRRKARAEDKVEPRKRSDEDLPRDSDADRERRRRSRLDDREEPRKRLDDDSRGLDADRERRRRDRPDDRDEPRQRRESRKESDEDRSRLRDKIVSGVGVAAAAMGLGSAMKDEPREKSDKEPRRRRSPTEDRDRRDEPEGRSKPDDRDRRSERPKEREYERERHDSRDDTQRQERHRREAEEKLNGEAVASGSDSDNANKEKGTRQTRPSIAFNPNDASDISQLREQLAAMNSSEKEKEKVPVPVSTSRERPSRDSVSRESFTRERPARESFAREEPASTSAPSVVEKRREFSQSPSGDDRSLDTDREDERGRELALAHIEGAKSVRVVSPPRDKSDDKPLKGILKQPRVSFPEEENFVREGAAPHKEDKKAKEVPPGARWTKISRKVVNPEALTIGKERFEVRDDFVIVLRVLDKEEIQAYAAATQVLRERRRQRADNEGSEKKDDGRERDREGDRNDEGRDDEERRRRRDRRYRDEEYETEDLERDRDRERDRDYDRRRRHRRDDADDSDRRTTRDSEHHHHHHHRPHRERATAEA